MKDVAVALVLVAGRARLGVHVRHVEGHAVELEGGAAGAVLARLLAAQLARLRVGVVGALRALARLHAVRKADRASALLKITTEWCQYGPNNGLL